MRTFTEKRWIMVSSQGRPWVAMNAYTRKECIKLFLKDDPDGTTWQDYQKIYGWKCIKVKVTIESIN